MIARGKRMGIMERIKDKIGSTSLKHEIEILNYPIFFGDPIHLRITLKALNREVRVNGLEIDLIWEELVMRDTGYFRDSSGHRVHTGEGTSYKKHNVHNQTSGSPFTVSPGKEYSVDLTFTTSEIPSYRPRDKFYLKLHVDIPKAIDIGEKKDLEILPKIHYSAPMVAMRDILGFSIKPPGMMKYEIIGMDRWTLVPPEGRYPHLGEAVLSVDCPMNSDHRIVLTLMMEEDPRNPGKGIHEEMARTIQVQPEYLETPDRGVIFDFLSRTIDDRLLDAERDFGRVLGMKDRESNVRL
ncbi:MAG: sporulation protein [Thermoplasmatota archaeon]